MPGYSLREEGKVRQVRVQGDGERVGERERKVGREEK